MLNNATDCFWSTESQEEEQEGLGARSTHDTSALIADANPLAAAADITRELGPAATATAQSCFTQQPAPPTIAEAGAQSLVLLQQELDVTKNLIDTPDFSARSLLRCAGRGANSLFWWGAKRQSLGFWSAS